MGCGGDGGGAGSGDGGGDGDADGGGVGAGDGGGEGDADGGGVGAGDGGGSDGGGGIGIGDGGPAEPSQNRVGWPVAPQVSPSVSYLQTRYPGLGSSSFSLLSALLSHTSLLVSS